VNEVTHILSAIEQGDPHAAEQLLPLVYDELRTLAAQKLARDQLRSPACRRNPVVASLTAAVAACILAYLFIPPVQELAHTVIRIATNKGMLEIEADNEDLEITIKQAGKDVVAAVVVNKKTKRTFELSATDGQIEAKGLGDEDGRLKTTEFALARGGRKTFSAGMLLAGWVQMFNGNDLTGWDLQKFGKAKCLVEDRAIMAGGALRLKSDRAVSKNFHLRIEMNLKRGGGEVLILFRLPLSHVAAAGGSFLSLKTPGPRDGSGNVYADLASMFGRNLRTHIIPIGKMDEWMLLELIAEGQEARVQINGKVVLPLVDDKYTPAPGDIALGTSGTDLELQIRKIEIKELAPEEPDAQRTTKLDFGVLKHAKAQDVADAINTWQRRNGWSRPDVTVAIVADLKQNSLKIEVASPDKALAQGIRKLVEKLDKVAEHTDKLKGRWAIVLAEFDGKALPLGQLKDLEIRFEDKEVEVTLDPKPKRVKGPMRSIRKTSGFTAT